MDYNPTFDIALLIAHIAMVSTGIGIAVVLIHDIWKQGK